jgi:hypothetical protein
MSDLKRANEGVRLNILRHELCCANERVRLNILRYELGAIAAILSGEAELMWRGKTNFEETRGVLTDTAQRLTNLRDVIGETNAVQDSRTQSEDEGVQVSAQD